MQEGLHRLDAIHAIGSILAKIIYDAITSKDGGNRNETYFREVAELTAEAWLSPAE